MTDAVVVVTGATGSAGRAVCARLARDGVTVAAVGRELGRLQAVPASSRHVCDLADLEAARRLADDVRRSHGRVDGLVHLVGGWRAGAAPEDWDWLEPRLLTSLRHATLAFRDDLSSAPSGRLVVISSASVSSPTWGGANYVTLKAAGEMWVSAVASGWRRGGTAAAVTFVVTSLEKESTAVDILADAVAGVWDHPAAHLNGSRISLVSPAAE